MIEIRNYIRGEWITIREGRDIEVRSPADQDDLVGKGRLASAREAEAAVAAASEALPAWSRMPAPKRGEIVELESKIAVFKEQHAASLHDMRTLNLTSLERTDRDLDDVEAQIRDLQEDRIVRQAQLEEIRSSTT